MLKKELAIELERVRESMINKQNALIQIVNLFENYEGIRDFGMAVKMMEIAKKGANLNRR